MSKMTTYHTISIGPGSLILIIVSVQAQQLLADRAPKLIQTISYAIGIVLFLYSDEIFFHNIASRSAVLINCEYGER